MPPISQVFEQRNGCWQPGALLVTCIGLNLQALALLLLAMCCYEPMYHCLAASPEDWPSYDCDAIEAGSRNEGVALPEGYGFTDVAWTYSALGLLAMAVHWFLMVDLAVFSTGLSAFVLVCAQVDSFKDL